MKVNTTILTPLHKSWENLEMFARIFRIGNDSAKINIAQIFSQEIYKYFYNFKRFFDNPPRCSPQRVDD